MHKEDEAMDKVEDKSLSVEIENRYYTTQIMQEVVCVLRDEIWTAVVVLVTINGIIVTLVHIFIP